MTPAEQRLTDHLATVVCGWTQKREYGLDYWFKGPALVLQVAAFRPLYDPRDTELVKRAWVTGSLTLAISRTSALIIATAGRDDFDCFSDEGQTESEAVCLAIARASGFDGEGK